VRFIPNIHDRRSNPCHGIIRGVRSRNSTGCSRVGSSESVGGAVRSKVPGDLQRDTQSTPSN